MGSTERKRRLRRKEYAILAVLALIVIAVAISMQQYVTKWSKFPATFVNSDKQQTPTFYLDIASRTPERARGLMFVNSLPENRGMIFVFPDMKQQSFWMKDVPISLDMIFLDDDFKVVGIVHNAEPMTEKSRKVEKKSMYVVELNGGLAKKFGISEGSILKTVKPLARGIYSPKDALANKKDT